MIALNQSIYCKKSNPGRELLHFLLKVRLVHPVICKKCNNKVQNEQNHDENGIFCNNQQGLWEIQF